MVAAKNIYNVTYYDVTRPLYFLKLQAARVIDSNLLDARHVIPGVNSVLSVIYLPYSVSETSVSVKWDHP